MNKLSVIIPTYKEPEYLNICLESLFKTQTYDNEVIVIVDGFYDLNKQILDKYSDKINLIIFDHNKGLPTALNVGVEHATNELILIMNDDNVFCADWDKIALDNYKQITGQINEQSIVLTINQIEPSKSIFKSIQAINYGENTTEFNLVEFIKDEPNFRNKKVSLDGYAFPFIMSKRDYMKVGGWDISYPGPHVVDFDFFLKLQMNDINSYRTHSINFYHFGGKATKQTDYYSEENKQNFSKLEKLSYHRFNEKWGYLPSFNDANLRFPINSGIIQGINF